METQVASIRVMRMSCSRGAAAATLPDQREYGLGRRLDEHRVEALGQQTRSVVLNEFELLRRDIDRVLLDLIGILGGRCAIDGRNELDREGAVVAGFAQRVHDA